VEGVLLVVALALGAALMYGVADYLGGVAARRSTVFGATTVNYLFAALVMIVAVAVTGGVWSAAAVTGGLIAGILALMGFITFFAALAAGPISLVTPFIALLSSVVPVVTALVLGEVLRPLAWFAIALAIAGSVLIGLERRASIRAVRPRTLALATVSGLAFGFATVALDRVPADASLIPVALDTGIGLVVLLALAAASRVSTTTAHWISLLDEHPAPVDTPPDALRPARPTVSTSPAASDAHRQTAADGASRHGGAADRRQTARAVAGGTASDGTRRTRAVVLAAGAGLLIGGGNALLMLALHAGNVAVVAVLTNLYPVATMVLAWVVLRERLTRLQAVGAALAVVASVLLGIA